MNKILTILTTFMWFATSVLAQDLITKMDGTDIEAKILEVNSNEIKFKKLSNIDGPAYVMNTNEIMMIRYGNEEKDIFNIKTNTINPPTIDKPNPKYKDLVSIYNYEEYTKSIDDKYNVKGCGAASFFIPGLGQAICGEWGRAVGFFCGGVALHIGGSMFAIYKSLGWVDGVGWVGSNEGWSVICSIVCYAGVIGLGIGSAVDATRVAKVKNLYHRDNKEQKLSLSIEPSFEYCPVGVNRIQPTPGLALKLKF